MRHAVLDTNILVSAPIRPDGPPGLVLAAVRSGQLLAVLSQSMLAEYHAVLQRPRLRFDAVRVEAMLAQLAVLGIVLGGKEPTPPPGLPDPADWPFIASALAAQCPLVTGNARHFPAGLGVRVMTAREWVEEVGFGKAGL